MNFAFTVQGINWTVTTEASFFRIPPRIAAGTTWGKHTLFAPTHNGVAIVPDSQSLAHEFFHVLHTNDFFYAISWSIGRIWGSQYWKNEERSANQYEIAHQSDPDFVNAFNTIRAKYPNAEVVTINHPV